MNEDDLEGSLVLEKLAAIGKVDDFLQAVDADDLARAAALLRHAKVDAQSAAAVLKKMSDADDDEE